MGDTGIGAEVMDIRTRRLITAQDLVADVAEADTEITAKAAVGKEAMVQTPSPLTKTDRKLNAADRTDVKEVGRRRRDHGLGGMGKHPRSIHPHPQEKVGQPSAPTGEGVFPCG